MSEQKELNELIIHKVINEEVDLKVNKNKSSSNYSIEYFFDEIGIDIDEYIEIKCMEIINNSI